VPIGATLSDFLFIHRPHASASGWALPWRVCTRIWTGTGPIRTGRAIFFRPTLNLFANRFTEVGCGGEVVGGAPFGGDGYFMSALRFGSYAPQLQCSLGEEIMYCQPNLDDGCQSRPIYGYVWRRCIGCNNMQIFLNHKCESCRDYDLDNQAEIFNQTTAKCETCPSCTYLKVNFEYIKDYYTYYTNCSNINFQQQWNLYDVLPGHTFFHANKFKVIVYLYPEGN